MIERDHAAAVDQEIERRDRPHQREFETHLVPEIPADAPALDIADKEKNEDRQRGRPGEQAERQQRSADQLRQRRSPAPRTSPAGSRRHRAPRRTRSDCAIACRCWGTSQTCCASHAAPARGRPPRAAAPPPRARAPHRRRRAPERRAGSTDRAWNSVVRVIPARPARSWNPPAGSAGFTAAATGRGSHGALRCGSPAMTSRTRA